MKEVNGENSGFTGTRSISVGLCVCVRVTMQSREA